MGRPRKNKAPKAAKPAADLLPFTIEIHGETVDLDLKLMVKPASDKSNSLDDAFSKILGLFGKYTQTAQAKQGVSNDDDTSTIEGIISEYVKESSDIELMIAYRKIVEEMRARSISRVDLEPRADNSRGAPEDKPSQDGEQPSA